ncbi:MAG: helix-turn-helix domain-containing protein [Firmicutes bacterium]|nr:helix-turn-helix domain-containing protein [Bacillota bacterium]
MKSMKLQDTIDFLETEFGVHISVCCFHKTLEDILELRFSSRIHDLPFCSLAKSTARGLERCLRCKECANRLALAGEPFEGFCIWGLYELVCPIFCRGSVVGAVYLGNLQKESRTAQNRRLCSCTKSGIDIAKLNRLAADTVLSDSNLPQLRKAVCLIAEEARLRLESQRSQPPVVPPLHPMVRTLLDYAEHCYAQQLSLTQLSRVCHTDAKYLGKLFLRQVGSTFRDHLNQIRLTRAAELLIRSDAPVLSIALSCGFTGASYFNRLFRSRYHCTPLQFRAAERSAKASMHR